MIRYSKDANIYVESKSPMHEKTLPKLLKASGVYRHPSVAPRLENPNARTITEKTLEAEYDESLLLLKSELKLVYQILGAKGGVTEDEWEHIKTSVVKDKYRFPDITFELGTPMGWRIDDKHADEFLKKMLAEQGFSVNIIPNSQGSLLYEDENAFLSEMAASLSVNMEFESLEKGIDSADYGGTKKRLRYITLYDFLKFHLGRDDVPSKEDFLNILSTCKDKTVANVIALKNYVSKLTGNFWAEYDKYLEFRTVEKLARWYSKSTSRTLAGKAYDYFSEALSPSMFEKALKFLKLHTAYMNQNKVKADTKGGSAHFDFRIERLCGDVYACVNVGGYEQDFAKSKNKQKLSSAESLDLSDLTYGTTYCVSLWEVIGNDAVKIGELPRITPGIKWPKVKQVKNNPVQNKLEVVLETEGGDSNLIFLLCLKKGRSSVSSPSDGTQIKAAVKSGRLCFNITGLEYDEEYTICVYGLADGGKYTDKIVSDYIYVPKKVQFETVVRSSATSSKYKYDGAIYFDFLKKSWPALYGDKTLILAFNTDRYPENPGDSSPGFTMLKMKKADYANSMFRIFTPADKIYPVLYIAGWLVSDSGERQQVIKNPIYHVLYRFKDNVIHFGGTGNDVQPLKFSLPTLRIFCFDKRDNLIYSKESVNVPAGIPRVNIAPAGKVKRILIEAANLKERQMYQFRNEYKMEVGKSKVSLF